MRALQFTLPSLRNRCCWRSRAWTMRLRIAVDVSSARSLATSRFNTLLLTLLGAIGLALSATGIYGVIAFAGDDEHGPALGVLGVCLGLGPRMEVGDGCLEDRRAGGRHREFLVELHRLVLGKRVGKGVAELVEGERHGAVAVGRVAQRRAGYPQRRERERQRIMLLRMPSRNCLERWFANG